MVIDEPILLWEHSTGYKPNWANESEFLSRIIHTPVEFILEQTFRIHT